jgi:DNA-binding protein HU-beta
MTKAELIEQLYNKAGGELTKRAVTQLVEGVFEQAAISIKKEGRYAFPGFGTFVVRKRKARKGRNPQTGEIIKIKASKTVGFRPAKALKDTL